MLSKPMNSSVWTRLAYLLAALWLATCLHSAVVTASPRGLIARQDDTPLPDDDVNDVDDPIPEGGVQPTEDKYPDLDKCRENCNVDKDKSLFYSRVGEYQDKPQKFADQEGLVLVRGSYPSGFTDKNKDYTGYTKFANRFSQAFAEKTSGITHVMLPTDSTDISSRVWVKTEYPALTRSDGSCTRIMKVDPDDFSKRCVLWDRSDNYDDDTYARCGKDNEAVPPKEKPEVVCPVSNDDHWPTCDECPTGWNPDQCVASEASAACSCNDPCGATNCIL